MPNLERGWLSRQFTENAVVIATWPECMRREAGFSDEDLTFTQREEAASRLRERADELDPPERWNDE